MALATEAYAEFSVDIASNFISAGMSTCSTNECRQPYLPYDFNAGVSTQKTQLDDNFSATEVQANACIDFSYLSTPACVAIQTI